MPETADSDDAHLMGGQHAAFEERVEYRDAAAKQWPGLGQIDALRNGRGPTPMAANLGGEGAMPADDGLLEALAHVVIAGEALAAVQATGAVLDVDFDLLVRQRPRVVGQRPQFSARLARGQCVNLRHVNYVLPA